MLNSFLMTSWLCLPLAPLNPVDEDTLSSTAFHFAVGAAIPSPVVSAGPIASAKYELLVVHPFMMRGTVDFKYGQVNSHLFPNGNLYSLLFGIDAIYYRGTDHLTGYIGLGPVLSVQNFNWFDRTADSLSASERLVDIDMQREFGYRLTLGLRYHLHYALEVAVVELYPYFRKIGIALDGSETRNYVKTRTGAFQIMLGYVVEI